MEVGELLLLLMARMLTYKEEMPMLKYPIYLMEFIARIPSYEELISH